MLLQFFHNGHDADAYKSIQRLEEAGFRVHFAPTSGASVLSIDDYEVIGGRAIGNMADQLIAERQLITS